MAEEKKKSIFSQLTFKLVFFCITASFGQIIYGWEVGMLNIVYSMRKTFGITFGTYRFDEATNEYVATDDKSAIESVITPIFTLGCVIGTFIAYFMLDRYGRVKPLIVAAICYNTGSILQTVSGTVPLFCIGRCIAGISCGTTMVTTSVYVSEMSPKEIRGTIGMLSGLCIQGGTFVVSLIDTISLKFISGSAQWRVAIGSQLIPGVIFITCVWFIKDTPRYMLLKSKDEKALEILAEVRNRSKDDKEVVAEYNDMSAVIRVERSRGLSPWSELITNRSLTYRVIIASFLQLLHMLIGLNVVGYYSSQIYKEYLGIQPEKWGAWLVTLNNFIVFVMSIPASKYVEKAGRRRLLLYGAVILGSSMFVMFLSCFLIDVTGMSGFGWLCVAAVYTFTVAFGWTWASAVLVWQSEIFPINIRTKANTVAILFHYVGSALVTSTISSLMKYLKYYTFLIFMGFGYISFVFVYLLVKETRGRSLEDMETLYKGRNYTEDDIEKQAKKHKMVEGENIKSC